MAGSWRGRIGDTIKIGLDFALFTAFSRLPVGFGSALGARSARLRGPTRYRAAHERAAR